MSARARAWGFGRRRDFDRALADRIVARMNKGLKLEDILAADPELPGSVILARWRRDQPEFDAVLRRIFAARRAAAPVVPEPVVEEVVEHIVKGGSFASFSRLPGAPSQGKLRRWMRDRNFAAAVARACEFREERYEDQILMIAARTAPGPIREIEGSIGQLKRQLVRLRRRPRIPLRERRAERARSGPPARP